MPQTCQILLSSLASIFLLEKTVYYHEVDMKKDEKFFPQTKPLHNSDKIHEEPSILDINENWYNQDLTGYPVQCNNGPKF